jgi:hypothetical protein
VRAFIGFLRKGDASTGIDSGRGHYTIWLGRKPGSAWPKTGGIAKSMPRRSTKNASGDVAIAM